MNQFEFNFDGRKARDKGLKQVADNSPDWRFVAMGIIEGLTTEKEFTGEDLRFYITRKIGPPHHHNAWGALVMGAVRRGHICKTGEYRQMKDKRSHARITPVYTTTNKKNAKQK